MVLRHFDTRHFADDPFATPQHFDTDILTDIRFDTLTFCRREILPPRHYVAENFDTFEEKKNILLFCSLFSLQILFFASWLILTATPTITPIIDWVGKGSYPKKKSALFFCFDLEIVQGEWGG